MATIDREIAQTESRECNLLHRKKLADAMAPDPREWSYTGEIGDDPSGSSTCTCGHPIRYLFPIERKRDGKTLIIGSTCIETTVPILIEYGSEGLAQDLQAANEKLKELIRERERLIREAKGDRRYQAVEGKAHALAAAIEKTLSAVWERCAQRGLRRPFLPVYFYKSEWRKLTAEPTAATKGRAAAALEKRVRTALNETVNLYQKLTDTGYKECLVRLPFTLEQFETDMEAIKTGKAAPAQAAPVRDPDDLTGRSYYATSGGYWDQLLTIVGPAEKTDIVKRWIVRAPDGKEWPVSAAALNRILEAQGR